MIDKIKSNERMASEIPTSELNRAHRADLDRLAVRALVICGLGASAAEIFTHAGACCPLT